MLGCSLHDPCGVEGGGSVRGLELLPMETVFSEEKTRSRTTGRVENTGGILHTLSGKNFEGYEIHMGQSTPKEGAQPFTKIRRGSQTIPEGAQCGSVYGTYVHGFFDKKEITGAILEGLGKNKHLDTTQMQAVDYRTYKQTQYDLLADGLRKSLDLNAVYDILNRGIS
jgi:adenosylcobyric acid synthase